MTIDRMYSGRLMPSRPMVYVAWIGLIHVVADEELQLAGLVVVERGPA